VISDVETVQVFGQNRVAHQMEELQAKWSGLNSLEKLLAALPIFVILTVSYIAKTGKISR